MGEEQIVGSGMRRQPREDSPSVGRSFYRGHGLGNDYLVFRESAPGEAGVVLDPGAVRAICHRTRGVGSDGIVVLLRGDGPPFRLRMFNPDGSEFERSGNGLRILASFLARQGQVEAEPFPVEVGGDRISMTVHGGTSSGEYDVSVDMGRASAPPAAVQLPAPAGGTLSFWPVSVGNPHAVVFVEALDSAQLRDVGPFLETHPHFPGGTNVQLARLRADGGVDILIWERGVGPTEASGTSACAVATAAVLCGARAPGEVRVTAPGGTLRVYVDQDLGVVLRGPVQAVMEGDLDPGFAGGLSGP